MQSNNPNHVNTQQQQTQLPRPLTHPLSSRAQHLCDRYDIFPTLPSAMPWSIASTTATPSSLNTSSRLPPWRFGSPAGTWTFDQSTPILRARREGSVHLSPKTKTPLDFHPTPTLRARREDSAPVSPKTGTASRPQHPGFGLPAFLEEETKGLSAEPAVDKLEDGEEGYEADDDATPTQASFARYQYQYYGGGNYFMPVRSGVKVDEAKEQLWRNAWPPDVFTPVVEQFDGI